MRNINVERGERSTLEKIIPVIIQISYNIAVQDFEYNQQFILLFSAIYITLFYNLFIKFKFQTKLIIC